MWMCPCAGIWAFMSVVRVVKKQTKKKLFPFCVLAPLMSLSQPFEEVVVLLQTGKPNFAVY